jgi:hypothetical protein
MYTLRNLSLAMFLGVGLLAAGGCSSSSKSDEHRSSDRVSRSSDRGDVERAPGSKGKLPSDARLVDEGRSSTLRYDVRDRGTVYLVDRTADVVVWSGDVRDGDRVTVDPGKNKIEINGREQARIDLKSNDKFELYFDRPSSSRY